MNCRYFTYFVLFFAAEYGKFLMKSGLQIVNEFNIEADNGSTV